MAAADVQWSRDSARLRELRVSNRYNFRRWLVKDRSGKMKPAMFPLPQNEEKHFVQTRPQYDYPDEEGLLPQHQQYFSPDDYVRKWYEMDMYYYPSLTPQYLAEKYPGLAVDGKAAWVTDQYKHDYNCYLVNALKRAPGVFGNEIGNGKFHDIPSVFDADTKTNPPWLNDENALVHEPPTYNKNSRGGNFTLRWPPVPDYVRWQAMLRAQQEWALNALRNHTFQELYDPKFSRIGDLVQTSHLTEFCDVYSGGNQMPLEHFMPSYPGSWRGFTTSVSETEFGPVVVKRRYMVLVQKVNRRANMGVYL
ncbi:hypothetical protein EDC01DRAFT_344930 [Geopyxis carbonaria]|nr:hypothetical protein EDC01DRAFT_344930 [Geopyxis carbonaria]